VAEAPTIQRIGQTDWSEIASRDEEHRVNSGTVKQSNDDCTGIAVPHDAAVSLNVFHRYCFGAQPSNAATPKTGASGMPIARLRKKGSGFWGGVIGSSADLFTSTAVDGSPKRVKSRLLPIGSAASRDLRELHPHKGLGVVQKKGGGLDGGEWRGGLYVTDYAENRTCELINQVLAAGET